MYCTYLHLLSLFSLTTSRLFVFLKVSLVIRISNDSLPLLQIDYLLRLSILSVDGIRNSEELSVKQTLPLNSELIFLGGGGGRDNVESMSLILFRR